MLRHSYDNCQTNHNITRTDDRLVIDLTIGKIFRYFVIMCTNCVQTVIFQSSAYCLPLYNIDVSSCVFIIHGVFIT